MLKVAKNETNTTKETASSNNNSNKIKHHHHHHHNHHHNNNNAEDRLSLLVKAAEKVEDAVMLNKPKYMQQIDFNQPNKMSSNSNSSSSSSSNFTTLSAFVNSATSNSSSPSSASSNASNNTNSSSAEFPVFIGKNGKPTRPFKAYPKEPLSLPIGGGASPAFNLTSSNKSALNHEPIFNYNNNNNNNTPVSISPPVNHTSSMSPLSSSPSSNSTSPSLNQTNSNNNNQQLLATALSAITTALNPNMNALMSPENLISLITSAIVASTAPPPPPPLPPQPPTQHKQPDADPWSSPEAVMSLIKSSSLNANEINSLISDGNINTKNLLNGLLNGTTDLSVSPSNFADSLSAFAYNSNDFCTQYRKRIQQAQERLLHKQVAQQQQLKTEFSVKVKTSEGGVKKRTNPMLDSMALEQQEQLIINKVQSRIINERDREEMGESVEQVGQNWVIIFE